MKDGRHIIWSNDIDYDDWREDLEEQYFVDDVYGVIRSTPDRDSR